MSGVEISSHAVERYVERVDRGASRREAALALRQILSLSRSRPVPRHWLRSYVPASVGLTFVTWSHRPQICLLVRDGVVVTLITRAMCPARPDRHLTAVSAPPRAAAIDVARWRWNGITEFDEAA